MTTPCRWLLLVFLAVVPLVAHAQGVIATIGGAGEAVAVNPRTNKVYSLNSGGASVIVTNGTTHAATNHPLPSGGPASLAVNPRTNRVYVSANTIVHVMDGDTDAFIGSLPASGPVAFDLALGRVYVATGTQLLVYDETHALLQTVPSVPGIVIAVDPIAHRIFVADHAGNLVTRVDGVTYATQGVAVDSPHALAVDAQRGRVYAASTYTDNVVEIDQVTLATQAILVGGTPTALAVDTVAGRVYVGRSPPGFDPSSVTALDVATRGVTHIPVGIRPASLALNAETRRLYVSNEISGSVSVIDTTTDTVATTVSLGGGVQASHVAVNPVTNRVYVMSPFSSGIKVIDGATYAVDTFVTGLAANRAAIDPVARRIVVATFSGIELVDPTTGTTQGVALGGFPAAVAVDAAARRYYVVVGNTVKIVDATTLGVRTVNVGTSPQRVAVDSARDRAFVTNFNSNSVSVVDGAAGTAQPIAAGAAPNDVVVDPETGTAYVGNFNGNSITVIDGATLATQTVALVAKPQQLALHAATNRLFVAQNTNKLAVIELATLVKTDVNLVATGQSVAVQPLRGVVYIGLAFPDTRIAVMNAQTLATSTITVGGSAGAIVADPARDVVYATISTSTPTYNVTILRGAANAALARALTAPAGFLALDPVDGRVYFGNSGTDLLRLVPTPTGAYPLTTVVTGPAGNTTTSAAPSLAFDATSTLAPNPSAAAALFYRTDFGTWSAATPDGADFAGAPTLTRGTHIVEAFALDAFGATTQVGAQASGNVFGRIGAAHAGGRAAYALTRIEPASRPTTTTITGVTPAAPVVGESVTVTVTVSSATGTPTGAVDVDDGGSHACTITLSGGSGSCSYTPASVGTRTLTASYAGATPFEPSADTESLTVAQAGTTTSIVSDTPDPSVPGQGVAVTFAVAVVVPGAGAPTGMVTVTATPGGASCQASVVTGTCTIAFGANGSETLVATYAGDADFASSASAGAPHTVEPGADLAATITNGVPETVAGTTTSFTIVASNAGPSAAPSALVQTTLDAALAAGAWSCTAAGGASCVAGQPAGTGTTGSGAIAQSVDVAVGGSVTFALSATVASSASSTLDATAVVASAAADADPSNNSATDVDAVKRISALAITKTNACDVVPGGGVTVYAITASNVGPSDAPGSRVADILPAQLGPATWACTPSGGAACAASGSGDIDQLVDLPAGSSVLFELAANVAASPETSVTNMASVAAALGVEDPTGANVASDTDRIVVFASGFENGCEVP